MTQTHQPPQRINWGLFIGVVTLLAAGGGGLISIGRMVEAKADKSAVEELQRTTVTLTVQTASTSKDVERILLALERLENKLDRAQAREGR